MPTNAFPNSDSNIEISPPSTRTGQGDHIEQFVQEHTRLRESNASAIDLGLLYRRGLEGGVWRSQATIARSLRVSKSYVSTAIRAAGLPDEIVAAVGGKEQVSFRVAAMLEEVIHAVGVDIACLRASIIGDGRRLGTGDVISSIATGRPPVGTGRKVSIKVSRTGKFVKIESPNIEKLIANLPEIEALLAMYL